MQTAPLVSKKSLYQGDIFNIKNLRTDPEKELETTIEVLFFKEPLLQCRYLARTAWLKKVLPIPKEKWVTCPVCNSISYGSGHYTMFCCDRRGL